MDPFTRIATLPTNSQGEITTLAEHHDQNNSNLATAMRLALRAVLEQGGVLEVGTVTVSGTVATAAGWSGITLDGAMGVMCENQSINLASLPENMRALLVVDVGAGETVPVNFTDASTGESLQHLLMAYPGRLRVIEGTTVEFPAPGLDCLPIARVRRTAATVMVDGLVTDVPVPAAWIRTRAVSTANRPANPVMGDSVFDTTLGQPVWWDGSGWVNADGTSA